MIRLKRAENIPLILSYCPHLVWIIISIVSRLTLMTDIRNTIPTGSSNSCFTIHVEHGFSNCGRCTTTQRPAMVYWYATLIKEFEYKRVENFKIWIKHELHTQVIRIERPGRYLPVSLELMFRSRWNCFNSWFTVILFTMNWCSVTVFHLIPCAPYEIKSLNDPNVITWLAPLQHCWQHYVPHPRCQPVCRNSASLFKNKEHWW